MSTGGVEERIDAGADVLGSGGDKLGSVAYVIVRPPQLEVTDIVVSTGALLGRDVVVPIGDVERVEDGKVYLRVDKDKLEQYPNYLDVQYQTPPEGWIPPGGLYYPPGAVLWPAGVAYPEPSKVEVNTPAGTVGLYAGMEVESSDGHKVGSIDAIDVDPNSEDVSAIVVKHGFLFTHDTRIPVDTVDDVRGGVVKLKLSRDEVQQRFEQTQ